MFKKGACKQWRMLATSIYYIKIFNCGGKQLYINHGAALQLVRESCL
jgi:hypothetical protein